MPGRRFILKYIFLKRETVILKVILHITSVSDFLIQGGILGSLQGGKDKCVRPGAEQNG
jgi:hypothetical protein